MLYELLFADLRWWLLVVELVSCSFDLFCIYCALFVEFCVIGIVLVDCGVVWYCCFVALLRILVDFKIVGELFDVVLNCYCGFVVMCWIFVGFDIIDSFGSGFACLLLVICWCASVAFVLLFVC